METRYFFTHDGRAISAACFWENVDSSVDVNEVKKYADMWAIVEFNTRNGVFAVRGEPME